MSVRFLIGILHTNSFLFLLSFITESQCELVVLPSPAFSFEGGDSATPENADDDDRDNDDEPCSNIDAGTTAELKSLLTSLLPPSLNPWADWPQLKLELLIHFVKAGFTIDVTTGGVSGETMTHKEEVTEEVVSDQTLTLGDEYKDDDVPESPSKRASLSQGVQLMMEEVDDDDDDERTIPLDHAEKAAAASTQQQRRLFAVIPKSSTSITFALLSGPLTLTPRAVAKAEAANWLDTRRNDKVLGEGDKDEADVLVEFDLDGGQSGI